MRNDPPSARLIHTRLGPLFLFSGVAALFYQVCWQRLLFAAFGTDIESVTIIVSVFMLGLGIGALGGGQLADRYPNRVIAMFSIVELLIGSFGFASPALIGWVTELALSAPRSVTAIANFSLLLVPTALMGATLPMLVAHVTRTFKNVGVSIGFLYFVNTLGAAAGAALTGFFWFYWFGLTATVYFAATLNLVVSAMTWLALGRRDE